MRKIAVVGGGAGGLIFSSKLSHELSREISEEAVKITVFDGSEYHEFQPGYLGVAFRGRDPERIRRPLKSLLTRGVELIPENCSKIDLDSRFVESGRTGRRFEFDDILIATGSIPDPEQIPGLKEANHDFHTSAHSSSELFRRISEFKKGRILTGIAGLPYKCPPSPNESAFMLDEFFTKRKLRDKVNITFLTPYLRPYSAEAINDIIEPMYRDRNIETVTGINLDSVDPVKKEVVSLEGETMAYDELILVPPHTTAGVHKDTNYVDSDNWILTDKIDLHIKNYDYAFAIGDTTNIPISKAGVEAHLQAIVVANNLISEIKGLGDRYAFTGRLQCSMETGYHQATFVIGTYDRPIEKIYPSTYNYIQKKLMERIYWSSLRGGFEWMFKMHFGADYYHKLATISPQGKSTRTGGM